jgi:hypothetical protein
MILNYILILTPPNAKTPTTKIHLKLSNNNNKDASQYRYIGVEH